MDQELIKKISILLKDLSQSVDLQENQKQAVYELLPETLDELIDLIKELPTEYYPAFFKCIQSDFTWHQVITFSLLKQLNQAKGSALLSTLTMHPNGKDLAIKLAFMFNDLTYIREVLNAIPPENRFDYHAIYDNYIFGPIRTNPDYLKIVLDLASSKQKLEIMNWFKSSLAQLSEDSIKRVIDPSYIVSILNNFEKKDRIAAFQNINNYYKIIEHASKSKAALKLIMDLFDSSEWTDVLINRDNELILNDFLSEKNMTNLILFFLYLKKNKKLNCLKNIAYSFRSH